MSTISITRLGPDDDPHFEVERNDETWGWITQDEARQLHRELSLALGQDDPITPEMANQVLHFFGRGGYAPGAFVGQLLHTMARADQTNQARLALGFPSYYAAMAMAMYGTDGGISRLAEIAQGSDHSHVGARECSCGWVKPGLAKACTCEECEAGHA